MKHIYLDNAATTKPDPEVVKIMGEVQEKYWGNPSSVHTVGQEARRIVDEGRKFASFFIGCEPEEVIFTSGGSEGNNLAIKGVIESYQLSVIGYQKPHVITSAGEHHAVLRTVEALEKEGKIEATYIKPGADGIIDPKDIEAAIKENTVLVSIIYVNNETGVVQPIKQIGEMVRAQNEKRKTKNLGKIYFHTDAVQAGEFMQLAPEYLKVDLMTLSGHKLHGPKGVGILYAKKGVKLAPQITGGGHEFGLRAGTENTAGIAGLHRALALILKRRADEHLPCEYKPFAEVMGTGDFKRVEELRNYLEKSLVEKIPNSEVNGSKERRAPHISNISFANAEGESIILNLDFLGISVSSGSACTSGSLEPSHVLIAMGVPPQMAHGSIRFSLSHETTKEEIDKAIEVMPGIIEKLRQMSPLKQ